MLLRKSFRLVPGLLGLLLAACGGDAPSQVELTLVAGEATTLAETDSVILPIVSIEAQIDGSWRTLSSEHRDIKLELGADAPPSSLASLTVPAGALTAVRLGLGSSSQHVELTAGCLGKVPICAGGKIKLTLHDPHAWAKNYGDARLQLTELDVSRGTCAPPTPAAGTVDMGPAIDPACLNVVCPPTQTCRAGACVPTGSCLNIVCPPGQTCSGGSCVVPDMSVPPDLSAPEDLSSHSCPHGSWSCSH